MKRWKLFFVVAVSFFVLSQIGYAQDDEYVSAYNYWDDSYDDARQTASNTSYFDGGSGSTSNTWAVTQPVGDVPDVGEGQAVGYVDQDGNYHSY